MDFAFAPEQELLGQSLRSFLRDHYSFEARRSASTSPTGWRPDIWRRLGTELDILGLAFPTRLGGSEGGAVETMIVMEEFRRGPAHRALP